ncbi:MAG: histidine kinase dimerization/phospho-acceptor domain-containing protein [Geminicoccaceae bacterium]
MADMTPPLQPIPSQDDVGHVAAWLNLSHELRTPAHAILGHVELLLSGAAGPLSTEMRTGLGDIQRAAMTLSAQIGEVVRLAEGIPKSEGTALDQSP